MVHHVVPTPTIIPQLTHYCLPTLYCHHNVPINVLIDTGCIQTNVFSERVAILIRQDGGKLRPANVVLTSGVGGISYPVKGFISMTVAIPVPDKLVKYCNIFVIIINRFIINRYRIVVYSIDFLRLRILSILVGVGAQRSRYPLFLMSNDFSFAPKCLKWISLFASVF